MKKLALIHMLLLPLAGLLQEVESAPAFDRRGSESASLAAHGGTPAARRVAPVEARSGRPGELPEQSGDRLDGDLRAQ
jgi:hypothetical protein